MARRLRGPPDVEALYRGVAAALTTMDKDGRKVGDCRHGVYAFYNYDGEPIYVGQTSEKLRVRIRRHLTNWRTDAVAMSVLDPFEVAEIEMWSFWEMPDDRKAAAEMLDQAEFTVYCDAVAKSEFGIVLNEKPVKEAETIDMPESTRLAILMEGAREMREHADLRLARRARTIANLARIISERRVQPGIRRTLWAQAQRLESLARQRLEEARPKSARKP